MLTLMQPTTHLFTIRIWQEEVDQGTFEWRGSIRAGIQSQVRHFVGLGTLADISLADVMKLVAEQIDEVPEKLE